MIFEGTQEREERAIRIDTVEGPIEGLLYISPQLRTLDDLNLSKRFVTVYSPQTTTIRWDFSDRALSIAKTSVLFVRELAAPSVRPNKRFSNFSRSRIRIRVRDHEVEGFCHVPPGGAPMKRLENGEHPFISLTTVLVTGPDEEVTVPFLAVNRAHITAVLELGLAEEDDDAATVSVTATEV